MARTPKRAKDPQLGGGSIGQAPQMKRGLIFDDIGSYGLRAFSGYVREEILPQLLGREAQRAYREMLDNSSVVASVIFAITQAMRSVTWRVEPPNDSAKAKELAEFVESMMDDMGSQTWDEFINDSLSMLGYGFAVHEIVYKRREGRYPSRNDAGASKYNDGRISWRRLPGRGQDTVIKWFFDENGQVHGLTQQPYSGPQIDLPIEKLLLFRPHSPKNNPEGRSILRSSYRAYYFIKRLEELEAIGVERLNGFPVITLPSELIERATSVVNGAPADPQAAQAYAAYKKMAVNIRMDEQMGAVLPSDVYRAEDGKPSTARMFNLEFLTPQHAQGSKGDTDKIITRYKIDILMTVLADFIQMGHEVRGTNNLAVTKVDMFYQAIEGWLNNHAAILNRYALPRLWKLNGFNPDLMPEFKPDMAQRLDLDSLGTYVANLAGAGMPMFPDEELQKFLREAGGMPEETAPEAMKAAAAVLAASIAPKGPAQANSKPKSKPKVEKQADMFEAE